MIPTLPSPGPRPARRKGEAWTDFDLLTRSPKDEGITIGAALLLTLLFHGALLFALPWHSGNTRLDEKAKHPENIEYTLEPLTPEEVQQLQFIQTNPEAPERPPPDTQNFSNRNQVAAQPKPNPQERAETPRTQGEVQESPTILTGQRAPASPPSPPPAPPPSAETPPAQPQQQQQPPLQPPAAQTQPPPPQPPQPQQEQPPQPQAQPTPPAPPAEPSPPPPMAMMGNPGNNNGEGVNVALKPVESTTDQPSEKPAQASPPAQPAPQTPPPQPQAQPAPTATAAQSPQFVRQRANVVLDEGVLRTSVENAGDVGLEAANAKFKEFGDYLQRMFEAISSAWHLECERHRFSSADIGTRVIVIYSLSSKGEIIALKVLDSSSTQAATLLCVNAIQSRAPYGPWTKEMIAQLREHEEIRITFYYR